ncbi:septum site-determining protein MinC [Lacticaseibacillus camelliae]|uniref:MinC protein n=1 Tax=Lacticaseibacillus camelliae DSM 22697 = JCM 13995 TaxID=1423730 RepID=A0A0R2FMA5_9LACO|nr:septum site-determining protein MinC [Lacticaseibacillus camelliae]KRN25597.1 minC protein [Lacticaseibacillus camelliae DSM 22697 = JCM 13995]
MDAVTLKGRKSGFELQLASEASLDEVVASLTTLLARVAGDTKDQSNVDFVLETGDRLLNEAQAKAVQAVFDAYPQFEIKTIHADVAAIEPLRAHFEAKATHLVGGILRSGQEADYTGDVLFLGNLHRGATLRTTGSIFVMGTVEGLLIAGALGDQAAVIVGDISRAAQIRIADTLEIIDKNSYTAQTTSYIDDLHALVHGKVPELSKLRPKLFRKLEEM